MYRDDVCAVCGESLPPDHFYCREHAAGVDDRLHELGGLLGGLMADLPRIVELMDGVAEETWDWLAEQAGDDDAQWPPAPPVRLRVHADEVDVDVDTEPGDIAIALDTGPLTLLSAIRDGLAAAGFERVARACAEAEGGNATH